MVFYSEELYNLWCQINPRASSDAGLYLKISSNIGIPEVTEDAYDPKSIRHHFMFMMTLYENTHNEKMGWKHGKKNPIVHCVKETSFELPLREEHSILKLTPVGRDVTR